MSLEIEREQTIRDSASATWSQTEIGSINSSTKDIKDIEKYQDTESSINGNLLDFSNEDPALDAKMRLVNHAINEIGFTRYHAKLFCLNGLGYAVDSLFIIIQSLIRTQVDREFGTSFPGITVAMYVGLFVGAIFWGFGADIIGRKFSFNTTLFLAALWSIVAGAAPNYIVLCTFIALMGFSAGGNLILDTTVFIEFIPSNKQWLLTAMAAWWGIGQTVAALVAWPFLANYSCAEDAIVCSRADNMGWRYTWFTLGALVFLISVLRVTVIRLAETPKYSICNGNDEEVIETLHVMANSSGRTFSLTLEDLKACGEINNFVAGDTPSLLDKFRNFSIAPVYTNIKGLFRNKREGISVGLNFLSWTLVGLAYPLYYVFLPVYLQTRGADAGDGSINTTFRNNAITNTCGIFGPVIAGFMAEIPWLGRKYTMVIGATATMAFMFGYTGVITQASNIGISCAINIVLNLYYGCLFAYTPEVLPAKHRATGNGIAVACNRVMGVVAPIIGFYSDTSTSIPIYICAALFGVLAFISCLFPFEPMGKHSV